MSGRIEQIKQSVLYLAKLTGLSGQRNIELEAAQTALSLYSYTQIAQICDDAFAPNRARRFLGRNEYVESTYNKLNQDDSPAPVTAAVMIGLTRAGNLESPEVGIVENITCALSAMDYQYRPFCDAIEQSIQLTIIMAKSSRPDYATSQQLAEIAKGSFDAFRVQRHEQIKFVPYVTPEGRKIASRKEFVRSLIDGESMAGASIRMAVDFGVLTTQPEKVSSEEREWLRRNKHYVEMVGKPDLNRKLTNFDSLLRD